MVEQIKKGLIELPDKCTALVVLNTDKYHEGVNETVRFFLHQKEIPGIYLTTNRPHDAVIDSLKNDGIDASRLVFIDASTESAEKDANKAENCIFVDSPEDLTGISLALTDALQKTEGKNKFIFLDSLSTLASYNESEAAEKFTHILCQKIREHNSTGILIVVKDQICKELFASLTQFTDHTLHCNED